MESCCAYLKEWIIDNVNDNDEHATRGKDPRTFGLSQDTSVNSEDDKILLNSWYGVSLEL